MSLDPAVPNQFVVSTNMKVGTYTIANAGAMPAPSGARYVTVTHTTVSGTDTLGTITVAGLSTTGKTISEVITPLADATAQGILLFASVASVTGAGWVISGGNDTLVVGCGTGGVNAYADLVTFRQYLRNAAVATDSLDPDSNLEGLALDAAARAIERSTGRYFATSTGSLSTRYFTPDAIRTNYFGRYICQIDDVADGTGMIVDWDSTGNGDYTNNIASTLWRLGPADNPSRGLPYDRLIFNIGTWIPVYGEQAVRVQALWGWASVPNVIINANLLQAARYIKRRDAAFGVTGSPEMGNQIRLLSQLDPDVELMLVTYRRMLVG